MPRPGLREKLFTSGPLRLPHAIPDDTTVTPRHLQYDTAELNNLVSLE